MQKKLSILKKISINHVNSLGMGGFKLKFFHDLPGSTTNEEGELTGFPEFLGMRVIGLAKGKRVGQGTFGPWCVIRGDFKAYDRHGNEFRGTEVVMPEPANSMVEAAVDAANGGAVEVAFDFMVEFDKGDRKYRFRCQPLTEVAASDPLAELANRVGETFALPSPAQAAIPVEPGEPAADVAETKVSKGKGK